jgi:thiol-disulfide isomerase/thioredoxin
MGDIILETRNDLVNFLKSNNTEFIIIKFYAEWCGPCKKLEPLINEKIKKMKEKMPNKFIYISVDIDECFDLFAYLKQKKMIKTIPSIFIYDKKIYKNQEQDKYYIPQYSISSSNMELVKPVLNIIK